MSSNFCRQSALYLINRVLWMSSDRLIVDIYFKSATHFPPAPGVFFFSPLRDANPWSLSSDATLPSTPPRPAGTRALRTHLNRGRQLLKSVRVSAVEAPPFLCAVADQRSKIDNPSDTGARTMANSIIDSEFPVWGLLPKKETGVTTFLSKYPEYDGRGTIIAVLDSGVDPGAPGLQETSDGKTKVMERFDCSGCGDVVTTTLARPKEGYVTGLSGRKLKIPDKWTNPSGEYRLGIKNSFDLYPKKLQERIAEERKEKLWDEHHKTALAESNRAFSVFEEETAASKQNLTEEQKLTKEDLEAKIENLNNSEKKYSDTGTFYDCVLYHDGSKWMACVDTSETGDLDKCPLLGEYSVTHEYAPLTDSDQLNFSINVHDDGNILELVGLCSSHGTHVASIAAAYFENEPEKNGIAPGAQIVSLTIGDGRLGSMETGTALVRAMIKVMELCDKKIRIHVINMSYGEHSHWSNTGRLGELMNQVVNKYGVVWITAAGNYGPALSTVGTPPDICQDTIIGVGAYVSPEMMVAEYSMRQKLSGMPYTWSSRGPTMDGGFGVSVCAPGGAITSVPNFTLRSSQLFNGTSMASPHVAGVVGLLVSGLVHQKLPYSPYSIKRSLENCALFLDGIEPYAQGSGLVRVDKSFQHLVEFHDVQERDVRFHVTCGSSSCKGIYVRTRNEHTALEYAVSVEPCYKDCDSVTAQEKIKFNVKFVLICRATYVSHPSHLDLTNMVRTFCIKIDTSQLAPGVHDASLEAYDVSNLAKGPVFKIPVTIVRPLSITKNDFQVSFEKVVFKPNTIKRHFVVVPEHATWGVIKMRRAETEDAGHYVVQCVQLLPKRNCKSYDINKSVTLIRNTESTVSFKVISGFVLEVVIAKYWASIGENNLDYSVSFHGVKPDNPDIWMHAAEGIRPVRLVTLRGEEIVPCITLKHAVQILRPIDTKISPLTSRDVLPKSKQIYELILTYNFRLTKATEVNPNYSVLSNVLYESEFESQFWFLFDSNKQMLGCGDYVPSKYTHKLDKGDYVLKVQIRHDRKDYLERLIDTNVLLRQKLPSNINVDVFGNHFQAITGEKKASFGHTMGSSSAAVYISSVMQDKLIAKINNATHYLSGSITYAKDELGKRVDSYPFKYSLMENVKKPLKVVDRDRTKIDEYNDSLRDLKLAWISKLEDRALSENLYKEIYEEHPNHLPTHSIYIQSLLNEPKRLLPFLTIEDITEQELDDTIKIIELCDKILNNVNQDSVLAYFSIKVDFRSDATKIKQSMDRQKSSIIEALCFKGIEVCRTVLQSKLTDEQTPATTSFTLKDIDDIWKDLLKFTDVSDKAPTQYVWYFAMWHSAVHRHFGRFLKYLSKLQEEKNQKELDEKLIRVYQALGWKHLVNYWKRQIVTKYPLEYKNF